MMMNKTGSTILAMCLLGVSTSVFAAKPCDELKADIEKQFQTKGVKNYTLDIVKNDAQDSGKTVGTCDGGTKHISYKHGGSAAKAEAKTDAPAPAAKP